MKTSVRQHKYLEYCVLLSSLVRIRFLHRLALIFISQNDINGTLTYVKARTDHDPISPTVTTPLSGLQPHQLAHSGLAGWI